MYSYKDRAKLRDKYRYIDSDSHPYDFMDFVMEFKHSLPEMQLWNEIRSRGIRLFPEFPIGDYFVDFGNPFLKIAIEVDGKEFHQDREKDQNRQREIEAMGWKVFRISAERILSSSSEEMDAMMIQEKGESLEDHPEEVGNWMQLRIFMDEISYLFKKNQERISSNDPEKYRVTLESIKEDLERRKHKDFFYDHTIGDFVKNP